jgi:protoporphyrinogen oxidase
MTLDLYTKSQFRSVLVLGAGFAGLGAARMLQERGLGALTIERESEAGGLACTDRVGDFLFDRAGHFVHCRTRAFSEVIRDSGIVFDEIERRSAVMLGDCVVPYPLQFNLWAASDELRQAVADELDQLPDSVNVQTSFDRLAREAWGNTLTSVFFEPYLEKVWSCASPQLPAEWASRFIPQRDLEMIRRGMRKETCGYGYNAKFLYPASGRLGDLAEALAAPLNGSLQLDVEVTSIDLGAHRVHCADGATIEYAVLVNSLPLDRFLTLCGTESPAELFRQAGLRNLRVGFRGRVLRTEHWCYVPDPSVDFFRVGFPCNVNSRTCPPGSSSISLEIGANHDSEVRDVTKLAIQALDYLAARGFLEYEAVECIDMQLIAPAYVANRMETDARLQSIAAQLREKDVILAGRFGTWEYLSLEDAYLSGADAAAAAIKMMATR